jgi:hypothetical protein
MKTQKNRTLRAWIGSIMFIVSLVCLILSIANVLPIGYGQGAQISVIVLFAGVVIGSLTLGTGLKQRSEFYFDDLQEKEIIKFYMIDKGGIRNEKTMCIIDAKDYVNTIIWLSAIDFKDANSLPSVGESYIKVDGALRKI